MPQRTVMLVDDEPHIPLVVGRKLEAAGLHVLTAADGEEALALADVSRPDLVITDLQMPLMNGIELARALRDREGFRKMPIILLTARGYIAGEEAIQQAGITRVLAKPFSVNQILDLVKELLELRPEAA